MTLTEFIKSLQEIEETGKGNWEMAHYPNLADPCVEVIEKDKIIEIY